MADRRLRAIGALWRRESRDRKMRFLSGVLNNGVFGTVDIVCFPVADDRKTENGPDYQILVSDPVRGRQENGGTANAEPAKADDDLDF